MKQLTKTLYLDTAKTQPVIITYDFQSARIRDDAHTENIKVLFNGAVIMEGRYADAFTEPKTAALPDGRILSLQLKPVGRSQGLYGFYATVNNVPLTGSSGDPYAIANRMFWVLLVYGALNAVFPALIILFHNGALGNIAFDWTAPAYGVLLVVMALLIKKIRHEWPLYVAAAAILAEFIHFIFVSGDIGLHSIFNIPMVIRVGLLGLVLAGSTTLRKARQDGFWK